MPCVVHFCARMNIRGVNENYIFKHRYPLSGLSFQFLGFSPDIEKRLETIIVKLFGKVCNDGKYKITSESFFQQSENRRRNDLYDVSFIYSFFEEDRKTAPEIENFRFNPKPCCWIGENVLKTTSCTRYYHKNVSCAQCAVDIPLHVEPIVIPDRQSTRTTISPKKNSHNQVKKNKTSTAREIAEHLKKKLYVSYGSGSWVRKNGTKRRVLNEKENSLTENNKNNSVIRHPDRTLFNNKNDNETNGIRSSTEEENIKAKRRKVLPRKTKTKQSSEDDIQLVFSSDSEKQGSSERESEISDYEEEEEEEEEDEEEEQNELEKSLRSTTNKVFNSCISSRFWEHLPPPNKVAIMSEYTATGPKQRFRRNTYSEPEMRLIISYLYNKKLIEHGKARSTWIQFLDDGYLPHRSIESLRNNFKRSILPKINQFGLPLDVLNLFLSVQ